MVVQRFLIATNALGCAPCKMEHSRVLMLLGLYSGSHPDKMLWVMLHVNGAFEDADVAFIVSVSASQYWHGCMLLIQAHCTNF